MCKAFKKEFHSLTDNIAVHIVQLQDGYQLQYILPFVKSSAESEMPIELRGERQQSQGNEYIYIMNTNN
jgi:hypothetical protein